MRGFSLFKGMIMLGIVMHISFGTVLVLISGAIPVGAMWVLCLMVSAFAFYRTIELVRLYGETKDVIKDIKKIQGAEEYMRRKILEIDTICYEDGGQLYEYIVSVGSDTVHCFSDRLYEGFDGMTALMVKLEKDGKLYLERGLQVSVKVKLRRNKRRKKYGSI